MQIAQQTSSRVTVVGAQADQVQKALENLVLDTANFAAIAFNTNHLQKVEEDKRNTKPKISKLLIIDMLIGHLAKAFPDQDLHDESQV